jgi:hypothetical protein
MIKSIEKVKHQDHQILEKCFQLLFCINVYTVTELCVITWFVVKMNYHIFSVLHVSYETGYVENISFYFQACYENSA